MVGCANRVDTDVVDQSKFIWKGDVMMTSFMSNRNKNDIFCNSYMTSSRIFVWRSHTKMMNSKTTKQPSTTRFSSSKGKNSFQSRLQIYQKFYHPSVFEKDCKTVTGILFLLIISIISSISVLRFGFLCVKFTDKVFDIRDKKVDKKFQSYQRFAYLVQQGLYLFISSYQSKARSDLKYLSINIEGACSRSRLRVAVSQYQCFTVSVCHPLTHCRHNKEILFLVILERVKIWLLVREFDLDQGALFGIKGPWTW